MIIWYIEDGIHERATSLATKAFDICKAYIKERAEVFVISGQLNKDDELMWITKKNTELFKSFMRNNEYFEVEGVCRAVALEVEE